MYLVQTKCDALNLRRARARGPRGCTPRAASGRPGAAGLTRKRTAGRNEDDLNMFNKASPRGLSIPVGQRKLVCRAAMCSPRGDASRHDTNNYQSPSSGRMRVIPISRILHLRISVISDTTTMTARFVVTIRNVSIFRGRQNLRLSRIPANITIRKNIPCFCHIS